jgi:hypothetical protein
MSKGIDELRCPHCEVRIKNAENLDAHKKYICGNEKCKKGFYLVPEPIEVFYPFMNL